MVPGADGIAISMGTRNDPFPNSNKISWTRIVQGPWHAHESSYQDCRRFVPPAGPSARNVIHELVGDASCFGTG